MTSDMFTSYFQSIQEDITTFIPYVLLVFASIWGLRIAISAFKRIAR